jgi:hypothetical protein
MVTDKALVIQASPREPLGYLETVDERGYDTRLMRLTGITGSPLPIGGQWAADSRHTYSKNQPWNDDQSLIWVEQKSVSPTKIILDAHTFAPIVGNRGVTSRSAILDACYEVRWRPGYPKQMVGWLKSPQALIIFEPLTDKELGRIPIPSDDPKFGWLSEGTISDDGRWTVLGTTWDAPQTFGRRVHLGARSAG